MTPQDFEITVNETRRDTPVGWKFDDIIIPILLLCLMSMAIGAGCTNNSWLEAHHQHHNGCTACVKVK